MAAKSAISMNRVNPWNNNQYMPTLYSTAIFWLKSFAYRYALFNYSFKKQSSSWCTDIPRNVQKLHLFGYVRFFGSVEYWLDGQVCINWVWSAHFLSIKWSTTYKNPSQKF